MYKCARCSYETNKKSNINNHFNRKRVCANVNNIELTDEIKQTILDNRIYHPPAPVQAPTTINNTINNVNIYNTVSKMDPEYKIEKLMEHLNREVINLDDYHHFNRMRKSLLHHKDREEEKYTITCRHIEDLFKEVIDFLQSFFNEDNPDRNVYNCFIKSNMFHIYDNDCWEQNTVPGGLKLFIKTLKSMVFDAYEVCLIRQLMIWQKRPQARTALKEYYAFILSFDNQPTFREGRNSDNKLLYNKNEPEYDQEPTYDLVEELADIWNSVVNDMKEYKKINNNKTLKQIFTNHSDKTFRNLDKQVTQAISGNTDFQNQLIM